MIHYNGMVVSGTKQLIKVKMAVSYKKLWHILIDRKMKKKDLEEAAGITHYQMYKLANDKDITTDVIGAICIALEVEPNDIMEFVLE